MGNWFRKPVNIGIAVVSACIFLVATFAVIWGVTTHTETVFLDTCVRGDRVYYIPVEGEISIEGDLANNACQQSQEVVWTKGSFPLKVTVVDHEGGDIATDHRSWKIVDRALEDANSQFGFQVFQKVVTKGRTPATVTIFWGVPYDVSSSLNRAGYAAGYVSHFYDRSYSREDLSSTESPCDLNDLCSYVGIRAVESDRFAYIVLMHELGHVLLLGHDDYSDSVMYPISRDDSNGPMSNWTRYSDSDVQGVQNNYAPRN